jgi:multicomponent Na+:H+ antiporter subunit E
MNVALLVFVLALGWALATGDFSILNLALGAAVAAVALFLIRGQVTRPRSLTRLRRMSSLGGLFLYELILSAVRVGLLVLRPDIGTRLTPGIVAFPLTVTRPAEITLLANLITLTPGTLSVDVSEDKTTLYVHAIDCSNIEAAKNDIRNGFEKKIMEAFQG